MKHFAAVVKTASFLMIAGGLWAQEGAGLDPSDRRLESDFLTITYIDAQDLKPIRTATPVERSIRSLKGPQATPTEVPLSTIPDVSMAHNFMTPLNNLTVLPTQIVFNSPTPIPKSKGGKRQQPTPTEIPFATVPDVPMDHNLMTPVNNMTVLPTVIVFTVPSPNEFYPTSTPIPTMADVPMSHNYMTPLVTVTALPTVGTHRKWKRMFKTPTPRPPGS